MILVFVFAYLAYQKAIAGERNGIKWAAIVAGAFIGTQLLIQFGIGILVGIYDVVQNRPATMMETYWFIPTIISVGLSILVAWLILRYLDKIPEEQLFTPPPPPPTFE
jgi:uncharacterized BrkB/YihY/UPF0761 family membrane protein